MRLLIILLALIAAALPETAFSADGPYVSSAIGAALFHNKKLTGNGQTVPLTCDPGAEAAIAVGYSLNGLRLEGEYSNRSGITSSSNPLYDNKELTVDSYMVNLLYDFQPKSMLIPFAGVGLGRLKADRNYHSNVTTSGGSRIIGNSAYDTRFGYQLTAGASIAASASLNFDFYYRYHTAIGSFKVGEGYELDYSSSNLMFGLRFTFR